jgi:hypothetical protein
MNPRLAMREAIKFNLVNIDMDPELAAILSDQMHDDPTFIDQLEEFFREYIENFGENYGLLV